MKKDYSIFRKTSLLFIFILVVLSGNVVRAQFYTGSQMDFGKNRMKYEDFFWTFYQYERYDVYFYEQGRDYANYVSLAAKKQMEHVEKLFDYQFDGKIQFLVYNKLTDFKQSNIGLSTDIIRAV